MSSIYRDETGLLVGARDCISYDRLLNDNGEWCVACYGFQYTVPVKECTRKCERYCTEQRYDEIHSKRRKK